jgi:hypothetical protein
VSHAALSSPAVRKGSQSNFSYLTLSFSGCKLKQVSRKLFIFTFPPRGYHVFDLSLIILAVST